MQTGNTLSARQNVASCEACRKTRHASLAGCAVQQARSRSIPSRGVKVSATRAGTADAPLCFELLDVERLRSTPNVEWRDSDESSFPRRPSGSGALGNGEVDSGGPSGEDGIATWATRGSWTRVWSLRGRRSHRGAPRAGQSTVAERECHAHGAIHEGMEHERTSRGRVERRRAPFTEGSWSWEGSGTGGCYRIGGRYSAFERNGRNGARRR